MTCGECPNFVQCDQCECGLCRLLTNWAREDYCWTATDEECICVY